MRAVAALFGLALLACGGSTGSSRAFAETHAVWTPPADGLGWVAGSLQLDDHRSITRSGVWRAMITGDRARVELNGARLEGDLAPGWSRISCTRERLQFSVGGIELQVPVGGYVELIAREGDRARVAAPVPALGAATRVVDGATVADDACSPSANTAAAGDAVANNGRLCLTGRPENRAGAALVPLPSETTVRVLERDGQWVRARARVFESDLTGWLHAASLDAATPARPSRTRVELTAPLRIGALEVPAGTRAWVVESTCESCDVPRERLEVALPEAGRPAVLRVPASDAAVRPVQDQEGLDGRPTASTSCLAPGAAATAWGSLSRESIRRVIREHLNDVRACYEARLEHRPGLQGRLIASFIIAGSGRVQSVVAHGDLEDRFVRRCVERALWMWRFPPPDEGGVVGVNYPFVMTSR